MSHLRQQVVQENAAAAPAPPPRQPPRHSPGQSPGRPTRPPATPTLSRPPHAALLLTPAPGHPQRTAMLLGKLSRAARLAVLEAAMPLASPEENDALAGELVELLSGGSGRSRAAAARAVARLFSTMPAHARSAVLCVARDAVVAAARSVEQVGDDDLARRSRAMLASATGAPELCVNLSAMLVDADPGVAADAERALVEIARSAGDDGHRRGSGGARAILDAVASFDQHRKRNVLIEALRLLATPSGLAHAIDAKTEWLADPSHPAHMSLRSLIRREPGADVARAALVLLRLSAQAPACRDRLLAAGPVDEHTTVLELAHLLEHPERRTALGAPKPGPRTAPRASGEASRWRIDPAALEQLSPAARRHLPRFFHALQLPRAETETYRTALGLDDEPLVRLAAVVAPGGAVDADARLDLAYDGDASVARAAAVRLAAQRPTAATQLEPDEAGATLARLVRSPHHSVRAVCQAAASDPHGPAARMAWRLALRRDRAGTLPLMRDRILMGPLPQRLKWIAMWRTAGLSAHFERDLCDMVEEYGVVPLVKEVGARKHELALAATAVAALGECPGERPARLLEHSLISPDPRIAANAVEALVRRRRLDAAAPAPARTGSIIVELKDSREHRVRANAALALIHGVMGPDARSLGEQALDHMLIDVSPLHRLAGLWLAERAVVGEDVPARRVAGLVQDLQSDDDRRIQDRALRTRRRLGVVAGAREGVMA